jgi:parallel beta-helix repeat protein
MMKTLDQVEPRTPIDSLYFHISESGSYYLTQSMTTSTDGIRISASDVCLDLMGFTISGDRGTGDYGIQIEGSAASPVRRVTIRNGVIRNFDYGVLAEHAKDCRIQRIVSSGNLHSGITLNGGSGGFCDNFVIEHCFMTDNDWRGIDIDASSGGQCNGNRISHCTTSGNGLRGIHIAAPSGQAVANSVTDTLISQNTAGGLYLGGSGGECKANRIERCTITGNGFSGVMLAGSTSNTHVNATLIRDCTVDSNRGIGIYLFGNNGDCSGNQLIGNTVRGNEDYGIRLLEARGNRIDSNHVVDQVGSGSTYGIRTDGTENVVVRNSCAGHTYNLSTVSGNLYGPYVKDVGNLDTASGGSNPWANFDFDD